MFIYLRADNAEPSDSTGAAGADIRNSGNVVKVYPLAVLTGYDALCTENDTVLLFVTEAAEYSADLVLSVGVGSLSSPACEYLVSVVMMMFVVMVMIVTAAGAVRTVVVMMLMLIVVVVVFMLVMVVVVVFIVIVVVAAAGAVRTVVVVMLMLVMIVMMVFMFIVIVVVMMVLSLFKELFELVVEGILLGHSVNELLAGELIPVGSNNRCGGVELLHDRYSLADLLLGETAGVAEDNTACIGYLVVEEFAEILVVHLALLCIDNSCEAVELDIVGVNVLNSADNVAELAYARGLDKDTVGSVVSKHLFESLAEVAYERAADTA